MPAFSFSTLAIAEPVVWLSVPGCMVAMPMVCASARPVASANAEALMPASAARRLSFIDSNIAYSSSRI